MRRIAGFRRVLVGGAALLLAACAAQPPQPAAPPPSRPPPPPPPPAADSIMQRHLPAEPVPHLTPEQLADERKALPRILALLGQAMKQNQDATIGQAGASSKSYAARSLVGMMATAATDPLAQAAFVNRLSDHDVEVLSSIHDERKFGEQIGMRLTLGALRGMPDERLPSVLRIFGDLYGAVQTPTECRQLMNEDGKTSLAYLSLLDRLPPTEVDELMSDYLAGARVLNAPPLQPLSPMEDEVLKLAIQHYFAELPRDQVERYRNGYKNPDSADRCWGVQLVTKALLANDVETQKLGGRMILIAVFGH